MKSIYTIGLLGVSVVSAVIVTVSNENNESSTFNSIVNEEQTEETRISTKNEHGQHPSGLDVGGDEYAGYSKLSNIEIVDDEGVENSSSKLYMSRNPFIQSDDNYRETEQANTNENVVLSTFTGDETAISLNKADESDTTPSVTSDAINKNTTPENKQVYPDNNQNEQVADSAFKMQCPSSLYMGGTEYEVNILKKMGCPKPDNYSGSW
jgi:hypothetical protein